MPRAIFSVSDKSGIAEFGKALEGVGWDIVATGRTAQTLRDAGVAVTPVEQITGLPEMLGGRVKTLHPGIHGAILARDDSDDIDELATHGYAPIDLVVCNLYPFQATVSNPDVSLSEAIEKIDIGGVTLIRAAAKNFERVTVVVDAADYESVCQALVDNGQVSRQERRRLAIKAFAHTRNYDTAIYGYLAGDNVLTASTADIRDAYTLGMSLVQALRYGENPHQAAGFYAAHATNPGFKLLQGKPLSYNNLLDTDAAWRAVEAYPENAAVVIVKHLNPTGLALGDTLADAFPAALESDPVSAFGGVVAVNRTVDSAFVEALGSLFVEVLIAPAFEVEAQELLAQKRKNCRLVLLPTGEAQAGLEFRSVLGGVLVQQRDIGDPHDTEWKVVTRRHPTPEEIKALQFAWRACQHVHSNAIVLARQTATVGIGGGLPSRVDAVHLAVTKAGPNAQGAVMASDAFFPFPDGLQVAIEAGVTAVVEPGGSIRDQDVIDAADEANIAMVFTKVRHFRH